MYEIDIQALTYPKFNTTRSRFQYNIFYDILDIFCDLGLRGVVEGVPLLDMRNY
jgi:hypothetical protein